MALEFSPNEIEEHWLAFIQVSIKAYSKHDANLKTLLSEKKGSKNYKELAGDGPPTMFQDLASKIGTIDNILYVYASPTACFNKDVHVFELMSKHSQQKCVVGLLNNKSEFLKSCSMLYI